MEQEMSQAIEETAQQAQSVRERLIHELEELERIRDRLQVLADDMPTQDGGYAPKDKYKYAGRKHTWKFW